MKHCLYCLRAFEGRGRCCDQWCARRVNGKVAWVTRSRRIALDRIGAAELARNRYRRRWRDIAMGRDEQQNLLAIFGLPLDLEPAA